VRFFRRRRHDAGGSSKPIKFHTRERVRLQQLEQLDRGRQFAQLGHFGEDRREEIIGDTENTQRRKICRRVGE